MADTRKVADTRQKANCFPPRLLPDLRVAETGTTCNINARHRKKRIKCRQSARVRCISTSVGTRQVPANRERRHPPTACLLRSNLAAAPIPLPSRQTPGVLDHIPRLGNGPRRPQMTTHLCTTRGLRPIVTTFNLKSRRAADTETRDMSHWKEMHKWPKGHHFALPAGHGQTT